MKCPKCGSETATLITRLGAKGADGFVCWSCHENLKELTTAEKLLWLTNAFKGFSIFECDFGELGIRLDLPNDKKMFFTTNDTLLTSKDKLINVAYEWAKDYQTK